ncbi:acyclic terpene utilization AtuA family protein [Pseudogulbenkiania subflava]|uniref:Acyclic terpene utilisation N-terminal domain-containing protein n=1 Tax=Pseudogulbenkiania subflava DSM 22618 TaxID=1123014 RepID=A0A1Y6C5L3_9NEIS|nr:acyclic terpene utilization AtuA family protein [Pseudogulbenkiania subflava]SMF38473.1 Protein of unknown function [Pseudogulbenkiania subflava DSM 22618]
MQTLRIGSGAGYSGDRIEPALELAEKGEIQYLVFECLAERTIALAQQAKLKDPTKGYDPLLGDRMEAVLRTCRDKGIKIITNMGAANPMSGAAKIAEIAQSLGIDGLKIAAVTGDDVLESLRGADLPIIETGGPVSALVGVVSANAYLGAAPIVDALKNGADVVITGRAADPALFLAPLIYEFDWSMDDWERLGKGTVVGHLLECAGQITGGYFADPGIKDVSNLARLGFPIAEVRADGSAVITKVEGSGGKVTAQTCKEQLLYEIHDPGRYLTPDVVADFSSVSISEIGPDRVLIEGGGGRPRTDTLKVSVGYVEGYTGEGQISYAGPGAAARGRLALEIVRERLKLTGVRTSELRFDLIGVDAIHGSALSASNGEPYEVRVRVAGRTDSIKEATRIGNEVETLYTNGPAGGGGATKSVREIVAVASVLLPRSAASPQIHYLGA